MTSGEDGAGPALIASILADLQLMRRLKSVQEKFERITNDELELKKKRRERKRFTMSREEVEKHVKEYLARGGKITTVELDYSKLSHNFNNGLQDFLKS